MQCQGQESFTTMQWTRSQSRLSPALINSSIMTVQWPRPLYSRPTVVYRPILLARGHGESFHTPRGTLNIPLWSSNTRQTSLSAPIKNMLHCLTTPCKNQQEQRLSNDRPIVHLRLCRSGPPIILSMYINTCVFKILTGWLFHSCSMTFLSKNW